ncbi:MAG: radical SAM protein [Victivallales bacterium]
MGFTANYISNLFSIALGRQPIRPLLFSYYITHRCNLNCKYCCDGNGRRFMEDKTPELSTDEAKKLIGIISTDADTIDITGGEPMMRNDLEEILAFAQNCGMRAVLNTKGIGIDARPGIIRNSDVIVISIDTLDVNKLSGIVGRPPDIAIKIIDSLDFILRKKNGNGPKLVISAVAMPENLSELSKVLDFAMGNGISFHLSPEIVGTNANPMLRGNKEYEELMNLVIQRKKNENGVLGVKHYLKGIRDFQHFPCHPLLMPVIRPDGRMYYPCLESCHAEISILETGSYRKALEAAISKYGNVPDCRDCCHIFCHMALSLLQRHPLEALAESRHWRA